MSAEDNKALVRRFIEILNQENWAESAAEFVASAADAEFFNEQHAQFRSAFHDYHFAIDDMIAEGDKVVVRGTVRAVHRGEFPFAELKGVAPTGKAVEWQEIWIMQVVEGKFQASWLCLDGVSRLQQLGVLSPAE